MKFFRKLLASFVVGLTLAWGQLASCAITITSLGTATGAGPTTQALTVANSCAAGSMVVVLSLETGSGQSFSNLTDSGSNTWTKNVDSNSTGGYPSQFSYSTLTTGLTGGTSTITLTAAGTITVMGLSAACITSVNALDKSGNTNGGNAASATSVATGVLTHANEAIIGMITMSTNPASLTCGGSFTQLTSNVSSNPGIGLCTQVVSSTTSVAFVPSWSNTVFYDTDVVSFMGGACGTGLALMHVGC